MHQKQHLPLLTRQQLSLQLKERPHRHDKQHDRGNVTGVQTCALPILKKVADESVEVNAVSGATITCNGVNDMLKRKLAPYSTYLENCVKTNVEPAAAEAEAQVVEE